MPTTSTEPVGGRALDVVVWAGASLLIAVVVVFIVIRVTSDVADLGAGVVPPEGDFNRRYVLNPWIAYLHIVPGAIYLVGAPLQLSTNIRNRHPRFHRRLGRLLIAAGLVTAGFAIVVGTVMPFGDVAETSATIVFATYFAASLLLAFRAIRSNRVTLHRRWMIRAFVVGVGVGMIRVVIGIGETAGIGIKDSFGAAFWIAFVVMSLFAELWLRLRPFPPPGLKGVSAA